MAAREACAKFVTGEYIHLSFSSTCREAALTVLTKLHTFLHAKIVSYLNRVPRDFVGRCTPSPVNVITDKDPCNAFHTKTKGREAVACEHEFKWDC